MTSCLSTSRATALFTKLSVFSLACACLLAMSVGGAKAQTPTTCDPAVQRTLEEKALLEAKVDNEAYMGRMEGGKQVGGIQRNGTGEAATCLPQRSARALKEDGAIFSDPMGTSDISMDDAITGSVWPTAEDTITSYGSSGLSGFDTGLLDDFGFLGDFLTAAANILTGNWGAVFGGGDNTFQSGCANQDAAWKAHETESEIEGTDLTRYKQAQYNDERQNVTNATVEASDKTTPLSATANEKSKMTCSQLLNIGVQLDEMMINPVKDKNGNILYASCPSGCEFKKDAQSCAKISQ